MLPNPQFPWEFSERLITTVYLNTSGDWITENKLNSNMKKSKTTCYLVWQKIYIYIKRSFSKLGPISQAHFDLVHHFHRAT